MLRGDICGSFVPYVSLSMLRHLMTSVDSWEGKGNETVSGSVTLWLFLCFTSIVIPTRVHREDEWDDEEEQQF